MNSFQRKSLYAALAGAGALGVATTASAVAVNPNGLGQVLIYPYYTVNAIASGAAYNSLMSVVNTTDSAKAVKVRFMEGKNSREVLDFNLFLSGHDVWTAALIPNTAGGARIVTRDNSCTIPENKFLQAGVDFVNYAYTGTADDKGGSGLDRTREGYIEIIEMTAYTSTNCTSIVVTHKFGGGVPLCQSANHPLSDTRAASDAFYTSGGLFGGITLINVTAGAEVAVDATAMTNFNIGPLYTNAGSIFPNLSQAGPKISAVYSAEPPFGFFSGNTSDLGVYFSRWPTPTYNDADPVSASLMHERIFNEYVLDTGTSSRTDWVVTFPTKRFYVNVGTGSATKLFQKNFNGTSGSCDDVALRIWDREEKTTTTPTTFSPPPPGGGLAICWEANVITFNNGNVLASANNSNINTTFQNGWLALGFVVTTATSGTGAVLHKLGNQTNTVHIWHPTFASSGLSKTYLGLPVVGFAVQTFSNAALVVNGTSYFANYGGAFNHRYFTHIIN